MIRHLVLLLLLALATGCGSIPEATSWRLEGQGSPPQGLAAALARAADGHLQRTNVVGGLGATTEREGSIRHPGIPREAVVQALIYSRDDLPAELRLLAKNWTLVVAPAGPDAPIAIPLAPEGP